MTVECSTNLAGAPTSKQELSSAAQTPRLLTEIPGPKSRALVAAEAPYLAPGIQSISTLSGIAVARAEGSVIEDVDGNRYLDLAAGICVNALGHAHPALPPDPEGPDRRGHGRLVHHRAPRRGAGEGGLAHARRASTRSSSTRAAPRRSRRRMRLAKSYTKKFEFLSFWGGFHGKTAGTHVPHRRRHEERARARACPAPTTRPTPTATAAPSASSTPPAASSARSSPARS